MSLGLQVHGTAHIDSEAAGFPPSKPEGSEAQENEGSAVSAGVTSAALAPVSDPRHHPRRSSEPPIRHSSSSPQGHVEGDGSSPRSRGASQPPPVAKRAKRIRGSGLVASSGTAADEARQSALEALRQAQKTQPIAFAARAAGWLDAADLLPDDRSRSGPQQQQQ